MGYYTEQLSKNPQLMVFGESAGQVCGCILASVDDDHVLVGPVAVAADMRRTSVGTSMMEKVEVEAKQMGQNTLILGSLEDAEPFYLSLGFQPNLFIQLPEPDSAERLRSLNEGYDIVGEPPQEGWSKLMLRTPEIDKPLQRKYEKAFPTCYTQYVLIKQI